MYTENDILLLRILQNYIKGVPLFQKMELGACINDLNNMTLHLVFLYLWGNTLILCGSSTELIVREHGRKSKLIYS
jgi:hypothetical protein